MLKLKKKFFYIRYLKYKLNSFVMQLYKIQLLKINLKIFTVLSKCSFLLALFPVEMEIIFLQSFSIR